MFGPFKTAKAAKEREEKAYKDYIKAAKEDLENIKVTVTSTAPSPELADPYWISTRPSYVVAPTTPAPSVYPMHIETLAALAKLCSLLGISIWSTEEIEEYTEALKKELS